MTNPFEDESAQYLVLVNGEGQHSLWPAILDVPDGWRVAFGARDRSSCLAYVDESWTDMRPLSSPRRQQAPVAGRGRPGGGAR